MADIKIDGVQELSQKITGIVDEGRLKNVVGRACAVVERTAKQKAPIDGGELRRSIKSKVENNGDEIIGTVFTPLEYAPYRYVRSLNRAKSGKPKQLKYQ